MLGKTSVSMMVLIVAASVIGISSIHRPIEVITQPDVLEPTNTNFRSEGYVSHISIYASSDGKACVALVDLDMDTPRERLINLLARDENVCDLFSKLIIAEPKRSLVFEGTKVDYSVLPPGFRETLRLESGSDLYQVDYVTT